MISIIIPYTTGVLMLRDCLSSLKEQTYRNFEVILVQDMIPDTMKNEGNITKIEQPEELIQEFGQNFPITYIINTENLGVGACRNIGSNKAKGEYLYFLDMDDYLFEDTLEKLAAAADKKQYDLIYGEKCTTWFKRKVYLDSLKEQTPIDEERLVPGQEQKADTEGDDTDNLIDSSKLSSEMDQLVQDLFMLRKGLGSISVSNILIRRELVMKENICFDEDLPQYVDMIYLSKLVNAAKTVKHVEGAVYVKRKRNNPVQYPALCQVKSEERFQWFITAYERTRKNFEEQPILCDVIDQKWINYYCNFFVTRMRRSEFKHWSEIRFQKMSELSKNIPESLIRQQTAHKKRLLRALIRGQRRKTMLFVNLHLGKIKAKKVKENKRLISTYLYFHFFTKMSVKPNYIMCESFLGRNYADSPKNLFEYVSKNYPGKYQFIWSVDKKTEFPYPCKVVKRFGIRYAYYLARSKYFFFNMRQPAWMRKRKDTVFLQTWHGTPLKKLVFDQEEVTSATPLYKQQVYTQSRIWDYLVSDNAFSTEVFRSAFLYDKEIIETGYPRNDLLYSANRDQRALEIKRKLGLPEDKKVILYAPTWRDDEYYDKGQYKFALHMDLKRYQQELGNDYIFLLRTHYFIADALDLSEYQGFAYNVSKYDDITELYLISDLCITDYSSVFFDFANLRRPILFYTYDLDKYRDILRGFYLDIEKDVPGPLLFNDDEVIDAINNIDQVEHDYHTVYEQFCQRFCYLDDGQASKRIAEKVLGL